MEGSAMPPKLGSRTNGVPWVARLLVAAVAFWGCAGLAFADTADEATAQEDRIAELERTVAVLAAGTGLGASFLVWDGTGHLPVASEGGHADFAPRNPREGGGR